MGLWEWMFKTDNKPTTGDAVTPLVKIETPKKEVKQRIVYTIEYCIHYRRIDGVIASYTNTAKFYDRNAYVDTHKICNERTIKNISIVNQSSEDKFIVLDCGCTSEDFVTMTRTQFISCETRNNENVQNYTE